MPEEPFMLVSLEEAKAKKLANVMSNETCTKLLNHLAKKGDGATETDIAKALKIPLSTVHYNLKQLLEARLVVADEYHYSEKGREMLHYRLANKYIIIAPQEEQAGFLDALKRLLPIFIITIGVGAILSIFGMFKGAANLSTMDTLSMPETVNTYERTVAADDTPIPQAAAKATAPTSAAMHLTEGDGGGASETTANYYAVDEATAQADEPIPPTEIDAGGAAAELYAVEDSAILDADPQNETNATEIMPIERIVERTQREVITIEQRSDPTWWAIGSFIGGATFVLVLLLLFAFIHSRKK